MNKNNFDFLRFIFAFIVLLRHMVDLSKIERLSWLEVYLNSYVCVTGFFIISGYLIWRSYLNSADLKEYIIKRARRLLPAYILFVIIAAFFLSVESTLSLKSYYINEGLVKYIFYNLLFLNFIHPCLPGVFVDNWQCAVNGALWTIKVEVLFYIFVPIIFYYLQKFPNKVIPLLSVYLLSIIYKNVLDNLDGNIYYILGKQMPGFLCYFISGVSFNYYHSIYLKNGTVLSLSSILFLLIEHKLGIEIITPFAFSMLLFQFAFGPKKFNNFGKYGDISYGIYIYHFTIIQIFVSHKIFDEYNPYLVSILIILIVISISCLSWSYIEKPFLKRKNRISIKS